MNGNWIRYTAAQLAWIKGHRKMSRLDLQRLFVKTFRRKEVTVDNIKALCTRKGWKAGSTGRFAPGAVPANKGQTMPFNANSAKTQFKKGHRGGRAVEVYKSIGTERFSKEGYIERKIHDGMPLQSRWRGVHLIRWEKINGPVPAGYCLKSKDGNKSNTEPSNWELVPRSMLPRLAGRWGVHYDTAPKELKPTLFAIAKLEDKARGIRKGRKQQESKP